MTNRSNNSTFRHIFWRFSILTVILVFAITACSISTGIWCARQRYLSAQHLEKVGASVGYAIAYVAPERKWPVWCRNRLGLVLNDYVYHVGFDKEHLNQSDFAAIAKLDRLIGLDLDGTNTQDKDLVFLYEMESVRDLSLYDTKVTDGGVHDLLRELPNLQWLNLGKTGILKERGIEFEEKNPGLMVVFLETE